MNLFTHVAAGALLSVAAGSSGSIVGASVEVNWLASAPPSVMPMAIWDSFHATAFDERQGVPLSWLAVDVSANPTMAPPLSPGVLGGLVDSHFIGFDHAFPHLNGTITFSGTIVGVLILDGSLDATDAVLGSPGTLYPTGVALRGYDQGVFFSNFIGVNGTQLTFQYDQMPFGDIGQIRVLTEAVPAPGAAGLLATGSIVAARRRRRRG